MQHDQHCFDYVLFLLVKLERELVPNNAVSRRFNVNGFKYWSTKH